MKPVKSFQCHVQSDSNPNSVNLDQDDVTLSLNLRREIRKANRKFSKRRTDEDFFIDLPGTADYDDFFTEFIDPKLVLNIKGPFSNNLWKFSRAKDCVSCNVLLLDIKQFINRFYFTNRSLQRQDCFRRHLVRVYLSFYQMHRHHGTSAFQISTRYSACKVSTRKSK